MKSIPPLNALRVFDVVGRHLNFRSASDEIGVTQAAVAQQVRLLEENLGMALFERLPKGLAFTDAGRGYYTEVADAFDQLREATGALRPEPDKVVISVTPTFAAKWLIPRLPEFSERHSNVDLRILATEKVSSFHSDGVDIAIRLSAPPFGAALKSKLLFKQEIIAVAAPSLLREHYEKSDPERIAHLPKLHDSHNHWPTFLKQLNITDRSKAGWRLSQTALSIDAAVAGQGIALVSRIFVEREIKLNLLTQLTSEVMDGTQDFYMLFAPKRKKSAAMRSISDWISSKAHPTE